MLCSLQTCSSRGRVGDWRCSASSPAKSNRYSTSLCDRKPQLLCARDTQRDRQRGGSECLLSLSVSLSLCCESVPERIVVSYAKAENKHAIRHNPVAPCSLSCSDSAEVYRVAADHVVVPRAREVLGGGGILRWGRYSRSAGCQRCAAARCALRRRTRQLALKSADSVVQEEHTKQVPPVFSFSVFCRWSLFVARYLDRGKGSLPGDTAEIDAAVVRTFLLQARD